MKDKHDNMTEDMFSEEYFEIPVIKNDSLNYGYTTVNVPMTIKHEQYGLSKYEQQVLWDKYCELRERHKSLEEVMCGG